MATRKKCVPRANTTLLMLIDTFVAHRTTHSALRTGPRERVQSAKHYLYFVCVYPVECTAHTYTPNTRYTRSDGLCLQLFCKINICIWFEFLSSLFALLLRRCNNTHCVSLRAFDFICSDPWAMIVMLNAHAYSSFSPIPECALLSTDPIPPDPAECARDTLYAVNSQRKFDIICLFANTLVFVVESAGVWSSACTSHSVHVLVCGM